MVDSVQSTSLIPLPPSQTGAAVLDPLPVNAPRDQTEVAETRSEAAQDKKDADFDSYIENRGPSLLRRSEPGPVFDAADEIRRNSVYQGIGETFPL